MNFFRKTSDLLRSKQIKDLDQILSPIIGIVFIIRFLNIFIGSITSLKIMTAILFLLIAIKIALVRFKDDNE